MTATPKELLDAAQHAMDFAECGNTLTLARHILATVRADDDEAITMEWLQRSRLYGATEGMFRFQVPGTDVFIEWFSGDTCELMIGKSIIPNIDPLLAKRWRGWNQRVYSCRQSRISNQVH